jgi:FkbM family methyltransferase
VPAMRFGGAGYWAGDVAGERGDRAEQRRRLDARASCGPRRGACCVGLSAVCRRPGPRPATPLSAGFMILVPLRRNAFVEPITPMAISRELRLRLLPRLSAHLNRPHYVYRPRQLLRRTREKFHPSHGKTSVLLPWGCPLTVNADEAFGRNVVRNGVEELGVTELLFRLADVAELALDVGANVGYMTSVLARVVGPRGHVIACEPHPALFEMLSKNIETWPARNVMAVRCALSASPGAQELHVPTAFKNNHGIATLEPLGSEAGDMLVVDARRLDALTEGPIGVMKLDVEGHEAAVLEGAGALLGPGLRDLVFESTFGYPSAVTSSLESAGYHLFGLEQRLRGPVLVPPASTHPHPFGAPPNYLATQDPERALARTKPRGWRALGH